MSDMDKQDDQSRVMDRSFENIVIYFRHELEHITAGGRAYKVLSFRQRRQLISKGVIKFDRHSTPGSPRYTVSDDALQILNNTDERKTDNSSF